MGGGGGGGGGLVKAFSQECKKCRWLDKNDNKRATLKIWFVVFSCCTTGATDCLVMEDYSADAFILAFSRFSCRYGYTKQLLPDEGSQLVKGCNRMVISFSSLQHKLNVEYGVNFKICPVGEGGEKNPAAKKVHG